MASYSVNVGIVQRSKGQSATAAAAYNAREKIEDRRTGQVHDYTRAHPEKLLFSGIYAPKDAPEWTKDRAELWNRAEEAENRKDARVSRRLTIALPHELTPEQQRYALQDFVKENFTRRGLIADVNIHAPHHGDPRNFHAHLQVTVRKLDGQEFSAKKDRDQDSEERLMEWRKSWADIGNRHLDRHGHAPTLDHRTLKVQGIDREPTIHLGKDAAAMERRGEASDRGDSNRSIEAENRLKLEVHEIFIAGASQKAQEGTKGTEGRETSPLDVKGLVEAAIGRSDASMGEEGPNPDRPAGRMFDRVFNAVAFFTHRMMERAAALLERQKAEDSQPIMVKPPPPKIDTRTPQEITRNNIQARQQQEQVQRQPRLSYDELKAMLERDQAQRDHQGPER